MQFKGMTKLVAVLLSLCFVFSCIGAPAAYAKSVSDLQKKKDKISEQIKETEEKVEKLKKEKDKTQEYITELDRKIKLKQDKIDVLQADADNLQNEITDIQNNITETEQNIEKTQQEIDRKQAEFDKTYEEYCQRLKAMYISGSASNLEVLLTCEDISSILTRSQMIKSVSEQDSNILNSLMEKMSEIEKEKAALEKSRNKLKENKKKLETDKAKLDSSIAEIEAAKKELKDEVAELNATMKKLASQTSEYLESIDEDKDKLAEVEREIQKIYDQASKGTGSLNGSQGDGSHSGTLSYPTYSRSISAGYPNYSSGRYHGGIDFPVPTGTEVHAAAAGKVIVALNLWYSYGHYIIIDHGNGLSTLYAHNSKLLVGVGDHVSRGQTISLSGSTGNSTGPHVHFEVRINGQRVNPWNYL
ncbi:MAG: peptidoglycan DD-metalloendopeptidase family protein [Eubacterium sp.]|nr:peptidoglycan DD-metalloendopeptidase family protein [Eubacterium sp.]